MAGEGELGPGRGEGGAEESSFHAHSRPPSGAPPVCRRLGETEAQGLICGQLGHPEHLSQVGKAPGP